MSFLCSCISQKQALTVIVGLYPRTGINSIIRNLDIHILRKIINIYPKVTQFITYINNSHHVINVCNEKLNIINIDDNIDTNNKIELWCDDLIMYKHITSSHNETMTVFRICRFNDKKNKFKLFDSIFFQNKNNVELNSTVLVTYLVTKKYINMIFNIPDLVLIRINRETKVRSNPIKINSGVSTFMLSKISMFDDNNFVICKRNGTLKHYQINNDTVTHVNKYFATDCMFDLIKKEIVLINENKFFKQIRGTTMSMARNTRECVIVRDDVSNKLHEIKTNKSFGLDFSLSLTTTDFKNAVLSVSQKNTYSFINITSQKIIGYCPKDNNIGIVGRIY